MITVLALCIGWTQSKHFPHQDGQWTLWLLQGLLVDVVGNCVVVAGTRGSTKPSFTPFGGDMDCGKGAEAVITHTVGGQAAFVEMAEVCWFSCPWIGLSNIESGICVVHVVALCMSIWLSAGC